MPRTFDEITARRRHLAETHGLRLYVDRDGGRMYGPQPYADEYNQLAAAHGKAPHR